MLTYFLTIVFLMIAALLVLVILVQRGRGGGLAGAFGMGGGGGTAFGTKTGDVFTTITVILFAVFLLMAIGLNYRFKSEKRPVLGGQSNEMMPTPPNVPTPTTNK
jgi:preprotein translocase subunit SecG